MNILYYENLLDPQKGGVQKVTYVLASELTKLGHNCFIVYSCDDEFETSMQNEFAGILKFSFASGALTILDNYIREKHIDVVVNQFARDVKAVNGFYDLKSKYDFKLISELHTSPSSSVKSCKWKDIRYPKDYIRACAKQLVLSLYRVDLRQMKNAYLKSDNFVLLSSTFSSEMCKLIDVNGEKFNVISNPCTYENYATKEQAKIKRKEVIVVSRMNENPKRISKVLDIWVLLQKDHPDWSLTLVGDGDMLAIYKKKAKKMALNNVQFTGKQDPLEYYKRGALFFMTSVFEGFGMTLIEAQQWGCVPIVFDSFSALHDIVDNGVNGRIIPDCDIDAFASATSELMDDVELRNKLANNGIDTVKKFSRDKIIAEWIKIFEE